MGIKEFRFVSLSVKGDIENRSKTSEDTVHFGISLFTYTERG